MSDTEYGGSDDLAALDFTMESATDTDEDQGFFDDMPVAEVVDDEESSTEMFDEYAPTTTGDDDDDTGLESLAEDVSDENIDDEADGFLFTVTNPPETVSITASIDGGIHKIEIASKAVSMTEAELADEILVIANLARQQALAAQHTALMDNISLPEDVEKMGLEVGMDGMDFIRDMMESNMGLPTPKQAAEAQAEVFATRYTDDADHHG